MVGILSKVGAEFASRPLSLKGKPEPIRALSGSEGSISLLGNTALPTMRTLWIHYEPGLDQDSLYYENPIYPTLMGDRITFVSQNITVSMT